jgi:hypothetical protein
VSYELVQPQSQHSNQEAKKKNRIENKKEEKEKVLANLLDKTVYRSGDWYILLLMMKYACKGRAKAEKQNDVGLFGQGGKSQHDDLLSSGDKRSRL